MERTYLDVPFAQKDEAKALGARWDRDARKWYVPPGVDVAQFERWTGGAGLKPFAPAAPAGNAAADLALFSQAGVPGAPAESGISLSQLLDTVAGVVAGVFAQPVWVRVEVMNARASNGHVYLELAERTSDGRLLAKTNAAIWANTAARVLPVFEARTGAQIAPGIKLLVQARPVFKAQFGFNLEVTGIDPEYTLGDLEANKRKIRERLRKEGLFERNRSLTPPWDFLNVLVLAPNSAAGLGDFQAEAERLQGYGICHFTYVYSRFQGEGAAAEMAAVLRAQYALWEHDGAPDAVVIIRGGGAANDLAWLDDYELARVVCETGVPVLTGIGHERDNTILDEVANTRYDTPSKVIAGIERIIKTRTEEAARAFEFIARTARQAAQNARRNTEQLESLIKSQALQQLAHARQACLQMLHGTATLAKENLHEARSAVAGHMQQVRHDAERHVDEARQTVPVMLAEIRLQARNAVSTSRMDVHRRMDTINQHVQADLRLARRDARQRLTDVTDYARETVNDARLRTESLFREIAGQGPQKTLSRGFAVVRQDTDGAPVTSAGQARAAGAVRLEFHDGAVGADIQNKPCGDPS